MTAKKIEVAELKSLIKSEYYTRVPESTMVICVLELKNGFRLIGESACLNPADYKDEVGRKIAYDNAFEQLWKLEGYARAKAAPALTPKERVQDEFAELSDRLHALATLTGSTKPEFITEAQWDLLFEQHKYMTLYARVLEQRLDSWG